MKISMKPTMALKITRAVLSSRMTKNHWDRLSYGNGNNEEKVGEGVHYKNVFGSYFHGPILSRNANLAYRLVTTALKKKYGQDIQLPAYEDILSQEIAEEYSDVKSKADFS